MLAPEMQLLESTAETSLSYDPESRTYNGCTLPVTDSAIRRYAFVTGRYTAYDLLGNRWSGNWHTGQARIAKIIRDTVQGSF